MTPQLLDEDGFDWAWAEVHTSKTLGRDGKVKWAWSIDVPHYSRPGVIHASGPSDYRFGSSERALQAGIGERDAVRRLIASGVLM